MGSGFYLWIPDSRRQHFFLRWRKPNIQFVRRSVQIDRHHRYINRSFCHRQITAAIRFVWFVAGIDILLCTGLNQSIGFVLIFAFVGDACRFCQFVNGFQHTARSSTLNRTTLSLRCYQFGCNFLCWFDRFDCTAFEWRTIFDVRSSNHWTHTQIEWRRCMVVGDRHMFTQCPLNTLGHHLTQWCHNHR